MSIHTAVDPRQLAQLADDINQLTQPITVPVRQHTRRTGTHWTAITHPSLLDQLRAATARRDNAANRPERRQVPRSAPPGNLDALAALAGLYVALSRWHIRLQLPSPPVEADWQHHALRQLVGALPTLAPAIGDQLTADVHHWWRTAAVHTGWSTSELVQLRPAG